MGFDSSSLIYRTPISSTVIIRPNTYERGRANVVVYAPSAPNSISINLSATGLINGQPYTIKNAYNYNGPNVFTGVYSASAPIVSIPLNGAALTVATPFGTSATPPTSCPSFCVLVVKPS